MQAISHLPLPQTEPCSDYQFFSGKVAEKLVSYLVYAAKRDYLSVPITHVIVAFYNTKLQPVEFCKRELLKEPLLDDIKTSEWTTFPQEVGFFERDTKYNKGELIRSREVILLLENKMFEIGFTRYEKLVTFYYEENAKSAFNRYLTDNSINFSEDG